MRHFGKDSFYIYVATPDLPRNPVRAAKWRKIGRQSIVVATLVLLDLIAVTLSFAIAFLFRIWAQPLLDLTPASNLKSLTVLAYALLLWPASLWREGLYPGYGLTSGQQLRKQMTGSFYAGALFVVASVFFYRDLPMSRSVLLMMVLLSMFLLPLARVLSKRMLLRFGCWGSRVVVLGAGEAGRRVVKALKLNPVEGLHPVAFFDDDPEKLYTAIEGVQVVGTLKDADTFAKSLNIQHAVVAIPTMSSPSLLTLIKNRSKTFRSVQFVPELGALSAEDVRAVNLDGLLALEVRSGLYSRRNQMVKRMIDLMGTMIGGILVSPLLLLIYIWVRLDSRGPGFYWSERVGQNNTVFKCLKFRTMYVDADTRLTEVVNHDPSLRQEYEQYHKLQNDPRITRVGHILRKLSLDELPQLWNILRGEMSLVGPRPYLTRELPDMNGFAETILEARPGLTGYWQISGRNDVTFLNRLEMESHYVRSWSIWWDVVILFQTPYAVLDRKGAR